MKAVILTLLCCVLGTLSVKIFPPKVQLYSHAPLELGKENILICHVSDFHPPEVSIQIHKNGVEVPEAKVTDLAFEESWHFYLTKHANITPTSSDTYTCVVTHVNNRKVYTWDPDM